MADIMFNFAMCAFVIGVRRELLEKGVVEDMALHGKGPWGRRRRDKDMCGRIGPDAGG